jgi:hypothetical protein
MFTKKYIGLFIILFLPMFVVSTLLNFLYSLNVGENNHINWLMVILLAIVLDVFILWMQTRKEEVKKSE